MEHKKIVIRKLGDFDIKYHLFRRKVQKFGIKIYRIFNSFNSVEEKVSYENEAISITRRIIRMPDSRLFMTPRTNKRIIRNNIININIIIKNGAIHIYDNKIPYPTQLIDKSYEYICNFFDDEIEKRREEMEYEIEEGVKNILKSIFKKIVNYEEVKKNEQI